MSAQRRNEEIEQLRCALADAVRNRDFYNLEIMRIHNLLQAHIVSAAHDEQKERATTEWQVYVGIAQAIEALVNNSQNPLTPIEVRDALIFYGYDIGHYANPMAMVHQTLKRLAADQRIREIHGRYTRMQEYDDCLRR
jgi:hypothetical protein